jgi:hypothetical protein
MVSDSKRGAVNVWMFDWERHDCAFGELNKLTANALLRKNAAIVKTRSEETSVFFLQSTNVLEFSFAT